MTISIKSQSAEAVNSAVVKSLAEKAENIALSNNHGRSVYRERETFEISEGNVMVRLQGLTGGRVYKGTYKFSGSWVVCVLIDGKEVSKSVTVNTVKDGCFMIRNTVLDMFESIQMGGTPDGNESNVEQTEDEQKEKIISITITKNGRYQSEDGYTVDDVDINEAFENKIDYLAAGVRESVDWLIESDDFDYAIKDGRVTYDNEYISVDVRGQIDASKYDMAIFLQDEFGMTNDESWDWLADNWDDVKRQIERKVNVWDGCIEYSYEDADDDLKRLVIDDILAKNHDDFEYAIDEALDGYADEQIEIFVPDLFDELWQYDVLMAMNAMYDLQCEIEDILDDDFDLYLYQDTFYVYKKEEVAA